MLCFFRIREWRMLLIVVLLLQAAPTRAALAPTWRQAKRHKAFEDSPFIGLAVDGTTVRRCREAGWASCRPFRNPAVEVVGDRHHLTMPGVVGTGLTLPFTPNPLGLRTAIMPPVSDSQFERRDFWATSVRS